MENGQENEEYCRYVCVKESDVCLQCLSAQICDMCYHKEMDLYLQEEQKLRESAEISRDEHARLFLTGR